MSREPQRIVDLVTGGTDVAAAALRVAIYVEELVETPGKDTDLVGSLRRLAVMVLRRCESQGDTDLI